MGAFLLLFPRNDVTIVTIIGSVLWPRTATLSSGWVILMWVAWDVLLLATGAGIGVALWAHVAGFFAGFTITLTCLVLGAIKPTIDEQTLLQVLGLGR